MGLSTLKIQTLKIHVLGRISPLPTREGLDGEDGACIGVLAAQEDP